MISSAFGRIRAAASNKVDQSTGVSPSIRPLAVELEFFDVELCAKPSRRPFILVPDVVTIPALVSNQEPNSPRPGDARVAPNLHWRLETPDGSRETHACQHRSARADANLQAVQAGVVCGVVGVSARTGAQACTGLLVDCGPPAVRNDFLGSCRLRYR